MANNPLFSDTTHARRLYLMVEAVIKEYAEQIEEITSEDLDDHRMLRIKRLVITLLRRGMDETNEDLKREDSS